MYWGRVFAAWDHTSSLIAINAGDKTKRPDDFHPLLQMERRRVELLSLENPNTIILD